MTGPWWYWDPNGGPVAADNGDGTWTVTLDPIPTEDMEYLWVVDGVQEDLVHNAANGDCSDEVGAGALVTDYATYANRKWVIASGDVDEDVAGACLSTGSPVPPRVQFTVIFWEDDFSGPELDDSKWHRQTQPIIPGYGWSNNELQLYTNLAENAYVQDDHLYITAKRQHTVQQFGGITYTKDFSSARLNSKLSFKYGKVEVKAKLPTEAGTWPAIWTLGTNVAEPGAAFFGNTAWPKCGELDIMEQGVDKTKTSSAMHFCMPGTNCAHHYVSYESPQITTDTFHTYIMEWTPTYIRFFVDDYEIYDSGETLAGFDEFNHDHFLLLNVAMGGDMGGTPPLNFESATMQIDYVKVYQYPA